MADHPLRWGAEALWEQLTPQLPGLSVEVVARISSTNTALLERARIVAPTRDDGDAAQVRRSVESAAFGRRAADLQPCLLVAEHQTHGRGRQGRLWQAAPGASLTFSLALPLSPQDWSGLSLAVGVALFEPSWHAGVVGLVASKLKDRLHRPVIAFAPASGDDEENLRGSARSIAGFHIRDALAAIDAREPGLIERFGGHAMAAGLSLKTRDYARFAVAFDAVARELIEPERLLAVLHTDGELPPGAATLALARQLRGGGPWGQAFPEPLFDNLFECAGWKVMGERHLRLQLRDPRDGSVHDGVMFNAYGGEPPPPRLRAAYELTVNDWQGRETARLLLRHMEPA